MWKIDKLLSFFGIISGLVLFGVAVLIAFDTLIRFVIGTSFLGVYELTEVAFLIMVFLAFPLTQFRQKNIRIDILQNKLRKNKGIFYHLFEIINAILIFTFFAFIFQTGIVDWIKAYEGKLVRNGIINIPNTVHISFVIIGSALVCISIITVLFINYKKHFTTNSHPVIEDKKYEAGD